MDKYSARQKLLETEAELQRKLASAPTPVQRSVRAVIVLAATQLAWKYLFARRAKWAGATLLAARAFGAWRKSRRAH